MFSPVFDSPLHIKFYLLTSVKSSYCVSQNPGNFGYSSIVQVQVDSGESAELTKPYPNMLTYAIIKSKTSTYITLPDPRPSW